MSELGKQRLARLLKDQRSAFGENQEKFAKRFEMTARSVDNWTSGNVAPQPMMRGRIEEGLGWKPGIITDVLEDEVAEFWGLDDVRIPDPAQLPVARASQLTDDELLTEMTRRFKTYAETANTVPARTPEQVRQERFGLAATTDGRVTKTPKKIRKPRD